ncbi:MAG: LCP family protein [Synechococcus sp.]|nr:LCP family protein [Synechococcus sp.]
MAASAPDSNKKPNGKHQWLGAKPLRTILRISAAVGSVCVVGSLFTALWPEPERLVPALPSAKNPTSLAPFPRRAVTLMVVGVDANDVDAPINRAAPSGAANADSVMLIRVEAQKPLQILQMPTELGVNLPGGSTMQSLSSSYRQGGVALMADVVAEVVGLPTGEPSRFVVMPRGALRSLVKGLGDLDIKLNQTLSHSDQGQNYSVNLQAGQQKLNASQAEQLARFRPDPLKDEERRQRQQLLLKAIHEQLHQPNAILMLPGLVNEVAPQVKTDLSPKEWLSLAAAVLSNSNPPIVTALPLAPRAGKQLLRQLQPGAKPPLWPKPN